MMVGDYAYVKKYKAGFAVVSMDRSCNAVWVKIPKGDNFIEECVELSEVVLWSDFVKCQSDNAEESSK